MKSTQRIGLLLGFAFLLPALFFSVYEISSLNKDEKMIQQIYEKQLDAILFSINQYSDDILNSWISKIELGIDQPKAPSIEKLLTFNSSLYHVFVIDSIEGKGHPKVHSLDSTSAKEWEPALQDALARNRALLMRLLEYKNSGFQKVAALDYKFSKQPANQWLVFVSQQSERYRIVVLLVDTETFIQDLIGPRLQMVAQDQFVLSVFRDNFQSPVYSTLQGNTASVKKESLTKNFWIFPQHQLGIRTVGSTLQKIIDDRTITNLFLLIGLDIILIVAVILVFRNIKKEVELAQNKSEFVSNVSHEIRTPLALISMFAETLEMDRVKSEDKKKEYYKIISNETQRLSGIVNKILNFSQTEANRKILSIKSIQLTELVKEILVTYDFHLKSKGFEYEVKQDSPVWIKADREAFMEIVINLIDNAIKYSIGLKKIELVIRQEGAMGIVAIKDYGIGIGKKDQKHIFDKFYRVSTGDLAKSSGTGLGLSIVKKLMNSMNGRIEVFSELNKGSCFTLYFPIDSK
jgi:two-component system, OmpR family, phosphate regulon sensor histidine kinase PhoR